MIAKLKRFLGPVAIAVIVAFLVGGAIAMHIAQSSAAIAWWSILGSVLINIAVNTFMTKWNLASGEVAPGPSEVAK